MIILIEPSGQNNLLMSISKVKQVLVTGANGFVGSALMPELSSPGFDIVRLVRKKNYQDNLKIKTFYIDDLDNLGDLNEPLKDVDVVIHLAARVHVMDERRSDTLAEYRRTNVEATINLARQAALSGIKRFVFLSSIKVNGELTKKDKPFRADDTSNPQDPYGISKCEAEAGLIKLAKETGMEVVIIRPPLIYGPGVKANFLNMIKILHAGLPLPFGSINNKRSLVFIGNLVDLIIKVIDYPGVSGEIFLVSDDHDVSTSRLLNVLSLGLRGRKARLISLPESLLKIIFKVLGKSSLSDRLLGSLQLDIEKTKNKLDWVPPVTFDRGIKITVDSYLNSVR